MHSRSPMPASRSTMNTARNELIAAEAAAILRHARIAQIKRRAFGLMPIADDPREPRLRLPRRPRPLFVVGNSRLQRTLLNSVCKQRALMYRRLPN
jgi:hypothetical protein